MAPLSRMAEWVTREPRVRSPPDNPFLGMQKSMSEQIVAALDAWRDMRDAWSEKMFLAIYGSPALQAAVGIDPAAGRPRRRAPKSALHRSWSAPRIAELRARIAAAACARP